MTADKRITTDAVLKAIKAHAGNFTTHDIARALGCDEYPVRVACSWLRRYRIIEVIEGAACIRRGRCQRRPGGEFYSANLYRLRPQAQPADFDALFRAFGLGVK